MARAFRRKGSGPDLRYAARLDPFERLLVVGLMEQVRELLDPPAATTGSASEAGDFEAIVAGLGGLGVSVAAEDQWGESSPVPADARSFGDLDPALQRLLPTAHREDDELAAEFRRLTEAGLRRRKADNLERSILALRREGRSVDLDEVGARAMLVALTDVRLVLGERLGLRLDEDVEALEDSLSHLSGEDPVAQAYAVYDFLTWLQHTLAEAMLVGVDRR